MTPGDAPMQTTVAANEKPAFKSSLVSHRTQPAYDHQHEYEVPSEAPGATSMAPFTEDTGPMYATLTTPF